MKEVKARLLMAKEQFNDKLIATTGFGYSGIVLLYHIKDTIPKLPIYFIDTGFHFQETLDLRDKIIEKWGLNIITISNKEATADYRNPIDCCYQRKVLPLLDVINDDTVWISALRKDQSKKRNDVSFSMVDSRGNLKICPLYDKSKDDIWDYIRKNNIPYNPLHDVGYPSIGCRPCTTPVVVGEDERSGRWRGTCKKDKECGLHG